MQYPHQMYHRWPARVSPTAPKADYFGLTPDPDATIQILRVILQLPEHQIDLAKAKLTIDRMIDPAIDIDATLKQLDAMAAEVTAWWRLADASSLYKLNALRTYLYKAGIWNGHRPFGYDYNDLLGYRIRNKLLPNYLATRKGNCVSMPCLFIILGQKLGIDVTASLSPSHIFVKYRDDLGNAFDLETTANAEQTDAATLQAISPMTPEAIANGLYMQPLTKRETVAVMLEPLMEFCQQQGQGERHIAVAGLAVEYFPKNVNAMSHIGVAFYRELKRVFQDSYATFEDIPLEMHPYLLYLGRNNRGWFHRAEALGWRKMSDATKSAYLERLKHRQS